MNSTKMNRSIRWRLQMGLLCLPDDLNDLEQANHAYLAEQRSNYTSLQLKYQSELAIPVNDGSNMRNSCDFESCFLEDDEEMDPLSLFLIEKEIQERRKERYFRRQERDLISQGSELVDADMDDSNCSTSEMSLNPSEVLSVITKDLQRLQSEHHSCFFEHHKEMEYSNAVQNRCNLLKEVLYIHAKEHFRLSYQQGMHDIASLLMLVLEIDAFETDEKCTSLCQVEFILHDTYAMLQFILDQLKQAYGASDHAFDTPVEDMVQNILSKLEFVAGESTLYKHLSKMELPPELFCARWVRLMFAREVVEWGDALIMWDIFLDAATKHPSILSLGDATKYTRPGVSKTLVMGTYSLMQVLEMCAASYLWLSRDKILRLEPCDAFRYLVTIPPYKSSGRLLSTLLASLRRIQYGVLPSPKGSTSPKTVMNCMRQMLSPTKTSFTTPTTPLGRVTPIRFWFNVEGTKTLTEAARGSTMCTLFKGKEVPPPPLL